ncbi:MAG: hypothetical protein K9M44_02810 [Candidatus Pacebacteria bacterium]|nr:hypothetical protein [Candidatus Paceibacterota bacterium]
MPNKQNEIISLLANIDDFATREAIEEAIAVVSSSKAPLRRERIIEIIDFYIKLQDASLEMYRNEISNLATLLAEISRNKNWKLK